MPRPVVDLKHRLETMSHEESRDTADASRPCIRHPEPAKSPRGAGAFGGEREWKDSNLQPPVS